MTTTETRLLTADDLLRLHSQGVRGELIRGVLCETMSTGLQHGKIVTKLVAALMNFIEPKELGTLVASDTGIRLGRDPDTVREPDIGFISAERLPLDEDAPGYTDVVPDLVAEVVSPSDGRYTVHDKALMWLRYGVRLVWVVYPETRTVDVYQQEGAIATLGEDDALDGLDVLPGFTRPVSAIFGRKPPA